MSDSEHILSKDETDVQSALSPAHILIAFGLFALVQLKNPRKHIIYTYNLKGYGGGEPWYLFLWELLETSQDEQRMWSPNTPVVGSF